MRGNFNKLKKTKKRNTANGEILGITLLMEDVLNLHPDKRPPVEAPPSPRKILADIQLKQQIQKSRGARASIVNSLNAKLTHDVDAKEIEAETVGSCVVIQNYAKWHYFLTTWKRCELLKIDWGRRKLGVENINTPELHAKYR